MRRQAHLTLFVIVLLTGGCEQDPFAYIKYPDAGPRPDGLSDVMHVDGGQKDGLTDGKPDACKASGEICDNLDNDCNGTVDDVDPSALQDDAKNCGKCGNACTYTNAFGKCEQGQCKLDACAPGYHDNNKNASDGCEYSCIVSNGGSEDCVPPTPDCACDNIDNDCDGQVDEIFDTTSDIYNCGGCGTQCLYNNAAALCVGGNCQMGDCDTGYTDVNNSPKDGCEYQCPVWPPATTDGCDNVDNDCDGQIDEDFAVAACGPSQGECLAGAKACVGGNEVCQGGTGPTAEVCDNKDNDCDGTTDEDFDKLNDPRYCGPNCTFCTIPHAITKCVNGACAIAVCEQGWVNLDNQLGNGCEYNCTVTGAEICDGLDNDCNGKTDTADPGMSIPTGSLCAKLGECVGAAATCQGTKGWLCNYSNTVELTKCTSSADCQYVACDTTLGVCPGEVSFQETRCDDKDNNCNGLTDEAFIDKGLPCAEQGKYGICQGTGTRVCKNDASGTFCDLTSPGKTATDEACNGLDDDCDNLVDEETDDAAGKGVVDSMVHVVRGGLNYYIYSYEASRPDASSLSAGKVTARACSRIGVQPWGSVTFTEAAAACAASGKRLCTKQEWQLACQGPSSTLYPYGGTYLPHGCNGLDHAVGGPVAVGSMSSCQGGDPGLYDMSGNLREWTNDQQGTTDPPGSLPIYVVRGGAYHTPVGGLTCTFSLSLAVQNVPLPAIGFRCCSDTPP